MGANALSTRDAHRRQRNELNRAEQLARGLGWFSLGLGFAQILAPRRLARIIGARDRGGSRVAMSLIGVREIASGIGILAQPRSSGWVWARVGGDMMDLALLGSALGSKGVRKSQATAAAAAVAGVTALDVLAGRRLDRAVTTTAARTPGRVIDVTKAVTVNQSPSKVYRLWRDLENLPRFMAHLDSVRVLDDRRSHWKAKGPAGMRIEWDAEIIDDRPGQLLTWQSVEGADVVNSGSVRFVPAGGPGHGGPGHLAIRAVRGVPSGGPSPSFSARRPDSS